MVRRSLCRPCQPSLFFADLELSSSLPYYTLGSLKDNVQKVNGKYCSVFYIPSFRSIISICCLENSHLLIIFKNTTVFFFVLIVEYHNVHFYTVWQKQMDVQLWYKHRLSPSQTCQQMTWIQLDAYFENKDSCVDPKLTMLNIQLTGKLFSSKSNVSLAFSMRSPYIEPI